MCLQALWVWSLGLGHLRPFSKWCSVFLALSELRETPGPAWRFLFDLLTSQLTWITCSTELPISLISVSLKTWGGNGCLCVWTLSVSAQYFAARTPPPSPFSAWGFIIMVASVSSLPLVSYSLVCGEGLISLERGGADQIPSDSAGWMESRSSAVSGARVLLQHFNNKDARDGCFT